MSDDWPRLRQARHMPALVLSPCICSQVTHPFDKGDVREVVFLHSCVMNRRSPVRHFKPQRTAHYLPLIRRDTFTLQVNPCTLQATCSLFTATHAQYAPTSSLCNRTPSHYGRPPAHRRDKLHRTTEGHLERRLAREYTKPALGSHSPKNQRIMVSEYLFLLRTVRMIGNQSSRRCLDPIQTLLMMIWQVRVFSSQTSIVAAYDSKSITI